MNPQAHLGRLLRHLKALIAFDTQNPPRRLSGESLIFEYLRTAVGSEFYIEIQDHGKGRISFLPYAASPTACSMSIWIQSRRSRVQCSLHWK